MEEKKNISSELENKDQKTEGEYADWHIQALEELEEFIESQGIYIRQ